MDKLATSKRVIAAVIMVGVVVFQQKLSLSDDQITKIHQVVMAWIIGDSIRPTIPKTTQS